MRAIAGACCAALALAACGGEHAAFHAVELPVPAAEGSGESHLAVVPDGTVVLSWLEPEGSGHALRFARLGQTGWSAATTVAHGGPWFVNWADFPSVVPISDSLWAAHWLVRQPAGSYAYDVAVSVSTDGGRTWGTALHPHTDGTPTEHGFVTLFPWQGGAAAAWLDGRNMAGPEAGPAEGHAHGTGGMTLRVAAIGTDGSLSYESVVDGLTCDCCQTDVAATTSGPLLVYRDRAEGEIRDIYAIRASGADWGEPVRVAADGWEIDGCPVNGPAVDARDSTVAVAWFTGAGDRARVQLAWSADGGATFSAPVEVDGRDPLGRVDVALLDDGHAAVSWLQPSGTGAAVAVRRIAPDGKLGAVRRVAETSGGRPSGFPQMVFVRDRLVLSWTEAGGDSKRLRSAWIRPGDL